MNGCTCGDASSPLATEPASVRCPVDHNGELLRIERHFYNNFDLLIDEAQQLPIWTTKNKDGSMLAAALAMPDHAAIGLIISGALAERIETLARQKHADDCSESTHRAAMRGYPVSGDEE